MRLTALRIFRKWLPIGLLCALPCVLGLFVLDAIDPTAGTATRGERITDEFISSTSQLRFQERKEQINGAERSLLAHFTPDAVLDNPKCRLRAADSLDTALVWLPTRGGGTRFAIVDGTGIRHAGEIPFRAAIFDIARRSDGRMLAFFWRVDRDEPGPTPLDAPRPLRVFLDGQLILSHETVLGADIAGDGSSYYLIEPMAGETSRMIIHQLDDGTERHYDLGSMFGRPGYSQPNWAIWYSQDNEEIMFYPPYEGIGTHHFYQVRSNGREPRTVQTIENDRMIAASFMSSRTAYVTYAHGDGFVLERQDIEWKSDASPKVTARWSRSLRPPDASAFPFSISRDGRYLLTSGYVTTLLHTETGDIAFEMSNVDLESQLPRLRHVLGSDAKSADVGEGANARLVGDKLLVSRRFLRPGGVFEDYADVFELEGIKEDSEPTHRIKEGKFECSSGGPILTGLQDRDGGLTFRSG